MYFSDAFWKTIKTVYQVEQLEGYTEQELTQIEAMYGKLPKAVAEFYRTAGKTPALHHVQDTWITPQQYQAHPSSWFPDDMLLLLAENQWVCCAGIKKEDLHMDNPPVYVTEDNKQYLLSAPNTSTFISAVLLYQAVFAMEYVFDDVLWLEQEDFEKLEQRFEKYPYTIQNWLSTGEMDCYFDDIDNLVHVWDLDGEWQVLYGATNATAFERLRAKLADLGETE